MMEQGVCDTWIERSPRKSSRQEGVGSEREEKNRDDGANEEERARYGPEPKRGESQRLIHDDEPNR
jgi:hypothetical protein